MEHLTKSQIVLLTLFVSFVSSMATGIVVVTLMQQTPEPVLQSITNVIEKTIEKAVPMVVEKQGKQVIVKDEDLVVSAIDRNSKSVVSFYVITDSGDTTSAGVGTIVSSDGLVVTDKTNFKMGLLMAKIAGAKYTVQVIPNEKDGSLALGKLIPAVSTASTTPPITFTSVALGNIATLKVGQTAIVISGGDGKTIEPGLITNLDTHTMTDKTTKIETKVLDNIGLSQRLGGVANGAPIISLDGVVIGFVSIDEYQGSQKGITVDEAKNLIAAYTTTSASPKQKTL